MYDMMYDFANLLFSGACNLRCPHCIGAALRDEALPSSLRAWPLPGLEEFLDLLTLHGVRELSITGTNTDPQLYLFEERLLGHVRERCPGVKLSLHTNGVRALSRMDVFNRYDRATISIPSFDPSTYQKMTGRAEVPDVAAILARATIPIKISTLLTEQTFPEWRAHLDRCERLGLRRVVFRYPYADERHWPVLEGETPVRTFMNNPVYQWKNLEVTVWRFGETQARCLNLFSNGEIRSTYLLVRKGDADGHRVSQSALSAAAR